MDIMKDNMMRWRNWVKIGRHDLEEKSKDKQSVYHIIYTKLYLKNS